MEIRQKPLCVTVIRIIIYCTVPYGPAAGIYYAVFSGSKAASKTDSQIVVHLFDMIQDYMVTDMTKDQYVKDESNGWNWKRLG